MNFFLQRHVRKSGQSDAVPDLVSGFTLVELVVALGVFGILVTLAMGSIARSLRTQRQLSAMIAANTSVGLTIEQMAREIRTGYGFCLSACAPDELTFVNGRGEAVVYRLNNKAVERGVDSDPLLPITGADAEVTRLSFILFGNDLGDGFPPRVTIALSVAPQGSENDPVLRGLTTDLQTTVSSRAVDPGE